MSSDQEERHDSGDESDGSGSADSRSEHGDHKNRSRSRSRSYHSDRGKYRGRSRSRSRSRSRGHHKRGRYSYSRSRSRSYHKYSRSRSRSPYYNKRSSRYSRSRSRERSPYYKDSRVNYSRRYGYGRSYSRSPPPRYRGGGGRKYKDVSPMSNRRRHVGNRDKPEPTRCIGVFGLSLYTQERDLRDVYSRYGPIEDINVVYDRQSGRSRGFAFIYFKNIEDSIEAKERSAGTEIDGRRIRVDYSITERAHTPTPGIYLGKPTTPPRDSRGSGGRYRSPSPYYSRRSNRYSRSRSRSFSPR